MPGNHHNESEAMTRRKRIDPKLKAQGWDVRDYVNLQQGTELSQQAVAA
jgi:type I site-specific restriction endonuclease